MLFTIAFLVFSGAVDLLADSLEGQHATGGAWVKKPLQGWRELDYIPIRIVIDGGPVAEKEVIVYFDHMGSGGVPGFQNLYDFTPTSNVQFLSPPELVAPRNEDIWHYRLRVSITDRHFAAIEFRARLAAGAHMNPGSSLHLNVPSTIQIHKPGPATGFPDMALTKTGPATGTPGQTLTYTIIYTNKLNATHGATGVQISDYLPEGVTYVANSASDGGSIVGDTIFWDLPNLGPGSGGFVTYRVTIDANASFNQQLVNMAMILSAEDDANFADNTTTFTTTVVFNRPPIANDDSFSVAEDTVLDVTAPGVLANDTDPDGNALTAALVSPPAHGTLILNSDGSFTYTPAPNYHGADSFSYQPNDGTLNGNVAMVNLTVTPVNDPPVAQPDTASTPEDTAVNVAVLANDSDPDGDPLTIQSVTQPAHGVATINANGTVRYAPAQDYEGPDSFSYTISDGNGGTATALVTITVTPVNDPPVAQPDTASTPEDTAVNVAVLANDSDPDGDTLIIQSVTQPAHGTATINANGTVRYAPAQDYQGPDSFSYTISDGNGGTATALVTVTVTPVNDPPVARPDAATTPEDTPVSIPVLANDSDPDGDTLAISSFTQPQHGSVNLNADGTIRYSPVLNYNGSDTFSYTIHDGNGATASALVQVTVTPVNDPPVARPDMASTPENTAVDINVLANDSDPENDLLLVVGVTTPGHGSATVNPNGTIRYTPEQDYFGPDMFSYTISDGNGGSASALVDVTVIFVNSPPVARPDQATTPQDTPVEIDVLANDVDPDGDTLRIMSVSRPVNGTVTMQANGRLHYVPEANFFGVDHFTYTIDDGNGASASAEVTVTVLFVNQPPVAGPDEAQGLQNTTICLGVATLLANDSDPNGDPLTISGVSASSSQGGAVMLVGNEISYAPAADFTGTDTFTYTASDGQGGTVTGTVTVEVLSAPVQILSGLQFNHQTALHEQAIRVTNPLTNQNCGTMTAVRILVDGLPANARVQNASGQTNGLWYVEYNQPLAPEESVDLVVEFYLLDRVNLPNPTYMTQVVLPAAQTDPTGAPFAINRLERMADGRWLVEFASIPGRTYAIQYSSDLRDWKTAAPFVTAPANYVHWVDDGPPKTESKPSDSPQRTYRVLLLPTP